MIKSKGIKIFLALLLFFITVLLFYFAARLLVLQNVVIKKDFKVENAKIIEHLGLEKGRPIWSYRIKELERKLETLLFLDEYSVGKRYPDTIEITLKIRKPVAMIGGKGGNIYYIDRRGAIFSRTNEKGALPLLLIDKSDEIIAGKVLGGGYREVVELLWTLKREHKNLFNSISQLEIVEKERFYFDYSLYFRTNNRRIYLKNRINVELIKRGLSSILLLNELEAEYDELVNTNMGYYYKGD